MIKNSTLPASIVAMIALVSSVSASPIKILSFSPSEAKAYAIGYLDGALELSKKADDIQRKILQHGLTFFRGCIAGVGAETFHQKMKQEEAKAASYENDGDLALAVMSQICGVPPKLGTSP